MNTYHLLEDFAAQLTGDRTEAKRIIEESLATAIELEIEGEKIPAFVVVTMRNKCYDYNRLREDREWQAVELGTSAGNLEQLKRAIKEGRFLQ